MKNSKVLLLKRNSLNTILSQFQPLSILTTRIHSYDLHQYLTPLLDFDLPTAFLHEVLVSLIQTAGLSIVTYRLPATHIPFHTIDSVQYILATASVFEHISLSM